MRKYSDYNIIPIGDHCAISIILKELNLRKKSYPFDWVTNIEQLYATNIIYNIDIISEVKSSDNIDDIVKKYIGDAFQYSNVRFKYIQYDISQFYNFDYTSFRPNIKKFLSDFLL